MIRYNNSIPAIEGYVNGSWLSFTAGSLSTITLGTSAAATNPQRSGEGGTGFYSAASGYVEVASTGSKIVEWSASGENIAQGSLNFGTNNGLWQDTANFNLAVGATALPTTLSQTGGGSNGQSNIAVGYQSLNANTTGQYNVAIGYTALRLNTTGQANTGVGGAALAANTTGAYNTGLGVNALNANTIGTYNAAVGYQALNSNTNGGFNTAIGVQALDLNTTGANNTAVGVQALYSNTTGQNNVAVGNYALQMNTIGFQNAIVGAYALHANTTGYLNTAVGYQSLYANSTGIENTAIGGLALTASTTASGNTAVGYEVLQSNTIGNNNTAVGEAALNALSTGGNNTVLGYGVASATLTSGSNNILIGTSTAVDTSAGNTSNFLNIGNTIFATSTNTGTISAPAGYVGIGTTAPALPLDVHGNVPNSNIITVQNTNASGDVGIQLLDSTGAVQAGIGWGNSAYTGLTPNAFVVGTVNNSPVIIATATNERMRITGGGNVGIGTAAPAYPLEVLGDIHIGSFGNLQLDSGSYVRWNGGAYLQGSGSAFDFVGGNVGIGTQTPVSPLTVFSSSGTAISISAFNSDYAGSTGSGFAIYEGATSGNTFTALQSSNAGGTGVGSLVLNELGGNVGIGSTSPNTTLDVAGFVETAGQSRVTSTFSKTSSVSLAAITGLSATLVSGKTYAFDILLYTTSGTSGGIKADLNGGTATATAIIGDAVATDSAAIKTQTRISALNTGLCGVTAVSVATCHITGTITVNVGGTFKPEFAQNASNATASTVAIGSIMTVQQIN
jgi:hypothetical protein